MVGESDSGLSAPVQIAMKIEPYTVGQVLLDGENFSSVRGKVQQRFRRSSEMVFHGPNDTLDLRSPGSNRRAGVVSDAARVMPRGVILRGMDKAADGGCTLPGPMSPGRMGA